MPCARDSSHEVGGGELLPLNGKGILGMGTMREKRSQQDCDYGLAYPGNRTNAGVACHRYARAYHTGRLHAATIIKSMVETQVIGF